MSAGQPAAAPDRTRRPAPGPLRPYHFPPIHRRVLGNGLNVVVAELRSFPVVTVGLMLPSGAVADPEGQDGLAALTAGLLESGAAGKDAGQIARAVDRMGITLETWASWDVSEATFTGLTARLDEATAVLADLVLDPTFPEAEVERLRAQRLTGLAQSRAEAGSLAGEVVSRYLFGPRSPFGRPMAGTATSVAALTRADVVRFHQTRYRPQGATLFAAGDASIDQLAELAERHFGAWTGAPETHQPEDVRAAHEKTRIVVADRPGSVQSALRIAQPAPPRGTPDYFRLLVMNSVLGGTFSSRINMNLRERLGYTYGAHSVLALRRTAGQVLVSTAVQTEVTAPSVAEILRDMREMREAPVTEAELSDSLTYLSGNFPLPMQTTEGLAGKLETLIVHDLPDDYFDTYRENVMAVTVDDVLQAARNLLTPDRAVIVVAGDGATVAPELEALNEGAVEVVDPAQVLT